MRYCKVVPPRRLVHGKLAVDEVMVAIPLGPTQRKLVLIGLAQRLPYPDLVQLCAAPLLIQPQGSLERP